MNSITITKPNLKEPKKNIKEDRINQNTWEIRTKKKKKKEKKKKKGRENIFEIISMWENQRSTNLIATWIQKWNPREIQRERERERVKQRKKLKELRVAYLLAHK